MVAFFSPRIEAAAAESPEKPKGRRVYLVGAHSSGKTTLARWISREWGLPLVPEVARTVLGEWERSLDEIRQDPVLIDQFQLAIFERQLRAESPLHCFVSDRGCDHLAYAAEFSGATARILQDARCFRYMASMRSAIVFLVRPHRELLRADGVRAGLDWDSVVRIDAMTKFILKSYDVPHVEIGALEMAARVATVRAVLGRVPNGMLN